MWGFGMEFISLHDVIVKTGVMHASDFFVLLLQTKTYTPGQIASFIFSRYEEETAITIMDLIWGH
jgi:hypothetical protein